MAHLAAKYELGKRESLSQKELDFFVKTPKRVLFMLLRDRMAFDQRFDSHEEGLEDGAWIAVCRDYLD